MATKQAWAPGFQRIHQVFDRWVGECPDALALEDAHTRLTYSGLKTAVRETAEELRAGGVRPGDRLMLVAENSVATAVLLLAGSALDAWVVVVNARLSGREIDDFIGHSGARLVVYMSHVSAQATAHAERHGAKPVAFPRIGSLLVGPLAENVVPEPVHADPGEQVAAMIYTSGTSGSPKAVMLTHANLQFAAEGARDVRRLVPGDRLYGVMPMAHVVGLSTQLLGSLLSGATLLLVSRFDPAQAAKTLAEDGITVFTGVPVMFAKLLDWSRENGVAFSASKLRLATVSGAPLLPGLKSQVEEVLGMPLHNGYGLTELSPTVAMTTSQAPRSDCSVGQPMPGLELRFVDEQGVDVAPGEVGELWVRGPNVMKGYYRNPDLTNTAVDPQGWFNTGDLARPGADGALHVVGRTKELIIRSGFNVYPVEVEQVLDSHPDVVQSAVVGRPIEDNEEVVAFVELGAGSRLTEADLSRYLRERLSPYKLPAEIRFLEQFPAGSTGKVLKHVLKDMARQPG